MDGFLFSSGLSRSLFLHLSLQVDIFIHGLDPLIEIANRLFQKKVDWRFCILREPHGRCADFADQSAPFKKRDILSVTAMKSGAGRLTISSYLIPRAAAATCA